MLFGTCGPLPLACGFAAELNCAIGFVFSSIMALQPISRILQLTFGRNTLAAKARPYT